MEILGGTHKSFCNSFLVGNGPLPRARGQQSVGLTFSNLVLNPPVHRSGLIKSLLGGPYY